MTVEEQALIDTTMGQIWVTLFWREGELDLTLLQPDGTVIDPSVTETDPINMNFTSEPGYEQYFIRGLQPGIWTAKIYGNSTPANGSAYMLELWPFDATIFSVNFDRDEYSPGDLMKISASIEDSISASPTSPEYIYGVVMQVTVEDPALKRHSFELYDDGLHGDGKARDGIYANTFSDTLVTGIYKFFFQLSGLNNRAQEPFVRECFLAETVKPAPIPTPTPIPGGATKACEGEIVASDPVIVRPEDIGGSDRCDTCRYAYYPKAVSTSAGILATWRLGFDGQRPEPNAYVRLLDDNANPIGDVKLLFERNWTGLSSGLVSKDGGAVLAFCGRHHDGDSMTSVFLDPYGNLISEQRRSPTDRTTCGAWGAEAVWTGSHLLFAWTHPTIDQNVLLDVADAEGKSLTSKIIRTDGFSSPHIAIAHGRMLMVVATSPKGNPGQNHLAVHRFDLEGNEVGEPVILDPLTYELNGRIVIGNFDTPFIIPTADGWMLLASSKASGRYVAQLAPDGSLIDDPVIMDTDLRFPNGFQDVIPYGGGVVILGGGQNLTLFISPDGTVSQMWHATQDEQMGYGDLIEHQGHLFLTYTSEPKYTEPKTNQVLIRELKCVP